MNIAVVNSVTGEIVNRIVLDNVEEWSPPDNHFIAEETSEPYAIGGSILDGVYTPPPSGPPLPPIDLAAYAAVVRKQKEIGGIVSPTYGALYTDRETRAIIGQMVQSVDLGLIAEPINFKTAIGFSTVDRTTLIAIAAEIAAHVQSAFDTEKLVLSEIADGTITTPAEIDAAFG